MVFQFAIIRLFVSFRIYRAASSMMVCVIAPTAKNITVTRTESKTS